MKRLLLALIPVALLAAPAVAVIARANAALNLAEEILDSYSLPMFDNTEYAAVRNEWETARLDYDIARGGEKARAEKRLRAAWKRILAWFGFMHKDLVAMRESIDKAWRDAVAERPPSTLEAEKYRSRLDTAQTEYRRADAAARAGQYDYAARLHIHGFASMRRAFEAMGYSLPSAYQRSRPTTPPKSS